MQLPKIHFHDLLNGRRALRNCMKMSNCTLASGGGNHDKLKCLNNFDIIISNTNSQTVKHTPSKNVAKILCCHQAYGCFMDLHGCHFRSLAPPSGAGPTFQASPLRVQACTDCASSTTTTWPMVPAKSSPQ